MLNPKIKERWLKDLRSGEYNQTNGAMRDDHGYCCLGVLAVQLDNEAWDEACQTVPTHPQTWKDDVGIPSDIADNIGLTRMGELMSMNDSEGKTFEEIADYIEENL